MEKVQVDIVSDVMCPWCLIGWLKFEKVIAHYEGQIEFDVHWRPFELNPDMPEEGIEAVEFMKMRFGLDPEQGRESSRRVVSAAADVGVTLNSGNGFRMRNTFNAHRLLTWAASVDDAKGIDEGSRVSRQTALKLALFRAHFEDGKDVNGEADLVAAAEVAGLDGSKAAAILAGDDYADIVRAEQAHWRDSGISSVPSFVLNGRMLISGAQEPEAFIRVIDKKILAAAA